MAFVYLGGDDSTKPTYFEVIAADKLLPSIRAAAVYTLSVLSQRHPWVHRVLDWEEEVLALVMLLADWHSLSHTGGTLAESLYGLRRRRIAPTQKSPAGHTSPQPPGTATAAAPDASASDAMSRRQKAMSLAFSVLLPYVRARAEHTYRQLSHSVLGLALQRGAASMAVTPLAALQDAPWQVRVRHLLAKGFVAAYPYVHAGTELVSFGYQLAYLLSAAPCHRPALHVLGLQLARVSAHDLSQLQQQRDMSRKASLAATRRPGQGRAGQLLGTLRRGLLQTTYLVSDHARHALILAVFGFKALEWWFTSAEARLAAGKSQPPPPPPPAPLPAHGGVGLPSDPMCCPICKQQLVNPAQIATSGYVGCYSCVFEYVSQHACCPVTLVPSTLDHIRKLYDAA